MRPFTRPRLFFSPAVPYLRVKMDFPVTRQFGMNGVVETSRFHFTLVVRVIYNLSLAWRNLINIIEVQWSLTVVVVNRVFFDINK